MRCRLHPRKPVRSLLGAVLTTGPRRMRPGRSQSKFSAAGCGVSGAALTAGRRRRRRGFSQPKFSAAACGAGVYVSVPAAAGPWGECWRGGVEHRAGNVWASLRLPRQLRPRFVSKSPSARKAGSRLSVRERAFRAGPPAAGSDDAAHAHLRWQGPQPLAQPGPAS